MSGRSGKALRRALGARTRRTLLTLGMAVATTPASLPARAQTRNEARRAVDARQYEQALALFETLVQAQPENSDLLIETARVYGFADRHRQAVATYRRVLEVAPARRGDVLAALAWQTLWVGDAASALPLFIEALAYATDARGRADLWRGQGEACAEIGDTPCTLAAYQQALELQPGDGDLRRRIATAWLWQDDYEQAEQAWRALLAEDPNDRRSQAGLARTLNSAGRHNAAVVIYRDIDDGSDADVRFDHARALRWSGYDAAALPLLAGRTDADALWLRDWRIARELQPYGSGTIEYSTDSDRLHIDTQTVAAGALLTPTLLFEGGYRHVNLDGLDGSVGGNRLFGTLRSAFGTPGEAPPGLLVPALSLGLNDYDGWSPLTGSVSLRWLPTDLWRLVAEVGREVVETPVAIDNRITVNVASLGLDYRWPPRWSFGAALSNLRFSDGNDRVRVTGRFDYALHFKPRVVVGLEAAAFQSSLPTSFATPPTPGAIGPQGYWNPKRYAESRVFAAISSDTRPWEWYGRVAIGASRENDGDGNTSGGSPNLLEAGVAHDLGPSLRWRLFTGGSGSSFAVGNGGIGHWRRYVGFNLTAWF